MWIGGRAGEGVHDIHYLRFPCSAFLARSPAFLTRSPAFLSRSPCAGVLRSCPDGLAVRASFLLSGDRGGISGKDLERDGRSDLILIGLMVSAFRGHTAHPDRYPNFSVIE